MGGGKAVIGLLVVAAFLVLGAAPARAQEEGVGLVDPETGRWFLRHPDGGTVDFFFGNPGDLPFMGDWNCDGVDTPGLYRASDGFVYLRFSNTQGTADREFFFGDPGDVPLAGDWNGHGCDTVSVYRPSESRIYIINRLGSAGAGLGEADHSYLFGNPGDLPFTGDFDGDLVDEVGLHRPTTGFVYFRLSHTTGTADQQFFFGDPGDRLVAGDWTDDDTDSVGLFRPADASFHLRHTNTQGAADRRFCYGLGHMLPVSGHVGDLPGRTFRPCLETVATGLERPTFLTAPAGDPRLFVTEQTGAVRIVSGGTVLETPFLDLRGSVSTGGERGLLGLAFHPGYPADGRFFVNYTDPAGTTRVVEYRVSGDPDRADPATAREVLAVPQPFSNHNGGMLAFGPDGHLYVALGDGGGAGDPQGHGQDPGTLLGTILRLDVDGAHPYAVPPDNPFVGTDAGRDEVWAYGLRNPWRFAFDPVEGLIFIADVGQNAREEVNVAGVTQGGLNYGWNVLEGSLCFSPPSGCSSAGTILPVVEYPIPAEGCAVIGGFPYRGAALPELAGTYFYGDLCGGWVRSFRPQDGGIFDHRDWSEAFGDLGAILSFGLDGAGELYVLTADGTIRRLAGR